MTTFNANKKRSSTARNLVAASIISVFAISPTIASANEQSEAQKKENLGLTTGVVIGAIFGGPAGAFITGIAGNLIAKTMNDEEEIAQLTQAYKTEKLSNEQALVAYQNRIEQAEQSYQRELLALNEEYQTTSLLQAQNLLMSLQFSTGSSEIKPHYQEQIAALANIIGQSKDLKIDLSGYTDKQGSETLNQALSLARINAVKNALIDLGVDAGRINLFAYGEKNPVVASNEKEVSFYDRRVVIQLKNQTNGQYSQQTPANEVNAQTAKNF